LVKKNCFFKKKIFFQKKSKKFFWPKFFFGVHWSTEGTPNRDFVDNRPFYKENTPFGRKAVLKITSLSQFLELGAEILRSSRPHLQLLGTIVSRESLQNRKN